MSEYKKVWFVYYLPETPTEFADQPDPVLTGTEEEQMFFAIWFAPYLERYKETRDSLHLLDLFKACHENRIYPPAEVMDWLGGALIKFINTDGHADITKLLGLKSPERGKKNPLSIRKKNGRAQLHATAMLILCHFFRVSIAAAAEGVYAREKAASRPVPDSGWLEDQYRRKWKKQFDDNDLSIAIYQEKPEELSKFLASFPEDWRICHGLK